MHHLPHMSKPLPIIGVPIGVSVDAMTFSHVLNPGPCQKENRKTRAWSQVLGLMIVKRTVVYKTWLVFCFFTFIFWAIRIVEGASAVFHVLVVASDISWLIFEAVCALIEIWTTTTTKKAKLKPESKEKQWFLCTGINFFWRKYIGWSTQYWASVFVLLQLTHIYISDLLSFRSPRRVFCRVHTVPDKCLR